jgi:hypothetical protein
MKRGETLDTAKKYVLSDRNKDYQDPEDNFSDIAELWSWWKGIEITPVDVAIMSGMIKIARMKGNIYKEDNYVDLAGYSACAAECAEMQERREIEEQTRKTNEPIGSLWPEDLVKGTYLGPDGTIIPDAEMEGVPDRTIPKPKTKEKHLMVSINIPEDIETEQIEKALSEALGKVGVLYV